MASMVDLDAIIGAYASVLNRKAGLHQIHYEKLKIKTVTQLQSGRFIDLPKEAVLYEAVIEPNAGHLTARINTTKERQISGTVAVSSGLVKGTDVKIPFKISNQDGVVLDSRANYIQKIELFHEKSYTGSESIQWNVDIELKEDQQRPLLLSALLQEQQFQAEFTTRTKISGSFRVEIMDKKGKITYVEPQDFTTAVRYMKECRQKGFEDVQNMLQLIDIENNACYVTMKGTCKFQYGLKMKIKTDYIDQQYDYMKH